LAVLDENKKILMRKIVPTKKFADEIKECIQNFKPSRIIMGNATWSKRLKPLVIEAAKGIPFSSVDEKHSTENAKLRYYIANPPRGIWSIIPVTLQVPAEPYDDFAAVILAENYIDSSKRE
jgi:hypothetical protein